VATLISIDSKRACAAVSTMMALRSPMLRRGSVGGLRAGAQALVGRRRHPVAGATGCARFCCASAGLGGGRRDVCT